MIPESLRLFLQAFDEVVLLPLHENVKIFLLKFIPFILFFEVPVYLLILVGVLRYLRRRWRGPRERIPYYPPVSCVVLCYAEGEEVRNAIVSLAEQLYPGPIEIVAVVDGAWKNAETLEAVRAVRPLVASRPNRRLEIYPKWQRGGRVSSINLGVKVSRSPIVMVVDADTSFDNNMVERATRHFADERVVAVAGNLRVRNWRASWVTRHQAVEYVLSIYLAKIGLGEFNMVNNISGAFGVFRRDFVLGIGGWNSGTAEDLDMTIRIKNYFARHRDLRIVFEPEAIGHTDVPDTLKGYLNQRIRWDGDLLYIYRKHFLSFTPSLVGWPNFLAMVWTGILFQITMPMLIVLYLIYSFFVLGPLYTAVVTALVYLFYLGATLFLFLFFLFFVSERPRVDAKLLPWILLYPVGALGMRVWSALALLNEAFTKSHLDSSMAPWWVLKKSDL
ncbi:glycosyltransferase family 2 protein [Hydrogenimonas sp.]